MPRAITDRKKKLLQLVVQEYIRTGRPVGSKAICEHYDFDMSSATVRNDLAALEEEGFLSHPHTSAGRIPTDKGYKYYVDTLVEIQKLTQQEEHTIQHEFASRMRELEDVMTHTSKLLAMVSHYAGFVVASNIGQSIVQHIELTRVDQGRLLAIVVTRDGLVRHKMLSCDPNFPDESMRRLNQMFNERFQGATLADVKARMVEEIRHEEERQYRMMTIARALSLELFSIIDEQLCHFEGTSNIIGYDDDPRSMHAMYRMLEQKAVLSQVIEKQIQTQGVNVAIGRHDLGNDMGECSVVTSTYKTGDNVFGVLGVIGPKRMEYSKMISLVDFISKALNNVLKDRSKK